MKRLLVMFPDMDKRCFNPCWVEISEGKIESIQRAESYNEKDGPLLFMLPGLVDAHIHIESSMLCPSRFAEIAVKHGTVATVSDPHEIANVLGVEGIKYMVEEASHVPLKINYTVPSCVPATDFEASGARLGPEEVRELLEIPEMVALGEMMNFPGVIHDNIEVLEKINYSKLKGKPVDGHAPGVNGKDLEKYINAGISSDHEAVNLEEALEKIRLGMKILIREGSAAKNFEALKSLITSNNRSVMLCSDDLHPDDLLVGHINSLIKRGLKAGINIFDLLNAASTNPIEHYSLNVGQLRMGDPADFILVDTIESFEIQSTWINGQAVYENLKTNFSVKSYQTPNHFISGIIETKEFEVRGESGRYRIIQAIDGSLLTGEVHEEIQSIDGILQTDVKGDILKLTVVNRYNRTPPAVSWIRGFTLNKGAIASSVAHDSHNIIAIGCSDEEIALAVNSLIACGGGICVVDRADVKTLPLPVGGIMSNDKGESVAQAYGDLTILAKELGSMLTAPFMTLSFMALLVIPALKLGDRGLFDGVGFKFVAARVDE